MTLAERLQRPNSGCEHSEAVGGEFQQWWPRCEWQATFQAALPSCQPGNEERLDQSICANRRITNSKLCTELNVCFNAQETMLATLEYRKVCARCVWRMLCRNIKTIECKSDRTCWTTTKLKVTVSWTASSPVTRCGATTTSWNQNNSPWSGDMRNRHQRKSARLSHQQVRWCALSFEIGNAWSPGFPGTRTNHQLWPLHRNTKLQARISSQAQEDLSPATW
jgi:hypothetical protein